MRQIPWDSTQSIVYKSIYYINAILIMFIINIINTCSCVYYTYDIRENLKLGFIVKVVAALRGHITISTDAPVELYLGGLF